jgi:hypothetical protein
MTDPSAISITIDFQDDSPAERQAQVTQSLYQQLQGVPGLKVDRIQEDAPDNARSFGGFLWGLLQAEVTLESVKTLFGFLGDRLGDKPIAIDATFADGRVAAARETLEAMAKIQ